MLNNLGTLLIFFIIYPLLVLVYYLLLPFKKCCKCCKRMNQKLNKDLFYGMIITGIVESYATLSLCCLVSLYTPLQFTSYGLIVQAVSCLIFALIVVFMPVFIIRVFTKNFESLNSKSTT